MREASGGGGAAAPGATGGDELLPLALLVLSTMTCERISGTSSAFCVSSAPSAGGVMPSTATATFVSGLGSSVDDSGVAGFTSVVSGGFSSVRVLASFMSTLPAMLMRLLASTAPSLKATFKFGSVIACSARPRKTCCVPSADCKTTSTPTMLTLITDARVIAKVVRPTAGE